MSLTFHNLSDNIHRDQRGWVTNPFEGLPGFPLKFGHLHTGSIEPGAVRGNHFHPSAREWIFVLGGEYLLRWEDDGEIRERIVLENEYITIEIPPGTAHGVKNLSPSTLHFISYQNESLEETLKETRRKEIL